jgi:AmmeMemoRadiSam system protein B/AmmeMemoRadiSam system protein A
MPQPAHIALVTTSATHTAPPTRVREPSVAGLFYPAHPQELARTVDQLLAEATGQVEGQVRALIAPHAGYRYSGPTAARAYHLLAGLPVRRVIILAPSHFAQFSGAAVSVAEEFRTPLGGVRIDTQLAQALLRHPPFIPAHSCRVERPSWAESSPRASQSKTTDTPETWEHSDEVQLPFLQRTLKDFTVLPILTGQVDPTALAEQLRPHLDDSTLVVASSDLSHFHDYEKACRLDERCVKAICALDMDGMANQEACGKTAILTVMHLARHFGWIPHRLDYRNSGDTAGQKSSGVVGYAAVAFAQPPGSTYSPDERARLLRLARETIQAVCAGAPLPAPEATRLSAPLREPRGCFVTLHRRGKLRGCIGNLQADEPLFQAVIHNARNAAQHDSRFPAVTAQEVGELEVEISVLSEPAALAFGSPEHLLRQLCPGKDGVILYVGGRRATFLPQVWEQLPDKEKFLDHLARKAGGSASAWREPETRVEIYAVECFADPAP